MTEAHIVPTLEQRIGASWPHLAKARTETAVLRERLSRALSGLDSVDLSVVASGSVGRAEVTESSDLDWSLLVDAQVDHRHYTVLHDIKAAIKNVVPKEVGRERTFAQMVFSHDLVHLIGGADDTNANTTRRSLLLLESVPLCRREAYDRVVSSALKRYLLEDRSFAQRSGPCHVPRFLLNDFARYWWTMAVDFAYKHRERRGEGAALRNLKLRFSRKLLYVSGLISCFACELGAAKPGCCTEEQEECVECLRIFMQRTPLDVLASIFLHFLDKPDCKAEEVAATAKKLFDAYDGFVAILATKEERTALDTLPPEAIETDPLFDRGRRLSRDFRDGILELFFDIDGKLRDLTRSYGVF